MEEKKTINLPLIHPHEIGYAIVNGAYFFVDLFKYVNDEAVLKSAEELKSEINNIKSLNDYGYKYETRQGQVSRYLDNEPETKINIYTGTNKNADLSNQVQRY